MKQHALSETERMALDVITKHPALTPAELSAHLPVAAGSVSALTSRLVTLKKVNRLKVPMSPTYRYYPLAAKLPAGRESWDNALVKVKARQRGNGHAEPAAPPSPGMLLTIEVGANQSFTLSLDQARKVYEQLHALFGGVAGGAK